MRIEKQKNYFLFKDPNGEKPVMGFSGRAIKGEYPDDAREIVGCFGKGQKIAYLKQVHGAKINIVKKEGEYEGDGIFTEVKDLAIFIRTADCMPIYLYNRKSDVAGLIHMGWRSANAGILENIPYDLKDFNVILGAGLRKCCYEVGGEFKSFPRLAPFLEEREGKLFFDPVKFVKESLRKKALDSKNLFDSGICPLCSSYDVFSIRKSFTGSRILSFIVRN